MTGWSAGYVHDLGYTHGFYRELTPAVLQFSALASKDLSSQSLPVAYCELGCGQGYSANLLAAANPHIEFYATDFNPAQIAGAKSFAEASGVKNVHFYDKSFEDFTEEPLPQFDIIALHGIYSWIAPEYRKQIVRFIDRYLKPGGLVYISYNCLPGWSAPSPLRQVLRLVGGSTAGNMVQKIDSGIEFLERLQKSGARYFAATPGIAERIEMIKGQNRNYVAHEYMNADWTLFYHADVAKELADARLSFMGYANILDYIDAVNLTEDQQTLLRTVSDSAVRETMRDYCGNQQFRRDIFVRGSVALQSLQVKERWLEQRFALCTPREDIPFTVKGWLGDATLQEDVYSPLLDALVSGPRIVRELLSVKEIVALGWGRLQQALTVLVGSGHLQPALDTKGDANRRKSTHAFNAAVINRARYSADFQALASPVTGGGVGLGRFEQLFLLALSSREKDPVDFVWRILAEQGQNIMKDDKVLETPEENIAVLKEHYATFERRLPVLKSLGIL